MARAQAGVLAILVALGVAAGVGAGRVLHGQRAEGLAWVTTDPRTYKTPACHERPLVARAGTEAVERRIAPSPAVRLVDLPAEVTGAPGPPDVLARLTTEGWVAVGTADGVLLQSPMLAPPIVGAERITVTLRPHGATTMRLVASSLGWETADDREVRGVTVALDAVERTTVVIPVATTLGQSWADHRRDGALRRIEITTPGVSTAPEVEEIVVEGPMAAFDGAAAGVRAATVDEVVRPSWFVHAGATARLRVDAVGRLSWYAAALGAAAGTLTVGEAATTDASATWTRHAVDVTGPTDVVLSCAGAGVCLFGDPTVAAPSPGTDVLVLLVDTLRADHVGAWGGLPTPALDDIVARGAAFALAISPAPWTKPVVPSLMTGLPPTTHQVGQTGYTDRLPPGVPVVQERFRAAGWRTGSFAANPLGSTLSGLERGFDVAWPPSAWRTDPGSLPEPSIGQLGAALLAWVDEEPERPFFGWIHAMEPHGWDAPTYANPPGRRTPYQAAVAALDAGVGELLAALAARGRDPVVVLVSDHGESFRDHGVIKHGTSLYHSQLHVPLAIAGPGVPVAVVGEAVTTADLPATLLDLAGLEPLPGEGRSLLPQLDGSPGRPAVGASRVRFVWSPFAPPLYAAVRADGRKLVRSDDRAVAFDLGADPCEATALPRVERSVADWLDAWRVDQEAAAAAFREAYPTELGRVQAEDVELLRKLGYVE